MKKIGKILLLSGLTIATVGTIGLTNMTSETLQKSNVSSEVQAYNHNPNNILDNIFEKDGQTILPFIFKNSDQTITKKYVEEQFKKAGLTIKNLSSLKDIIVTGDEIKTDSKTYKVLIYGDLTGDGYVDSFDALEIVEHVIKDKEPSGLYKIAANVENKDDIVDSFDALRIVEFVIGSQSKLVVKEPLSTIEQNIECPKITLKGDDPQIVRLQEPYIEAGATVTDNKDKDLKVTIDSSSVNVNKIGTYYVTYKAVDSDENERVVTREVRVVDYATELNVTTKPTKRDYRYGEDIDLTGMVVTAKMKSSGDTPVNVDSSQYEVTGYDKTKIGTQTITVSYAGKEDKFTVEVHDYQIGIEVVFPKTEYKYMEELDLTNATVATLMASGAKGQAVQITQDMISGYKKDETIKQKIYIEYAGMTEAIDIEVKDYAISINITQNPDKQYKQKYGQELDLTGMVVKVNMAKAGEKTLTQAEYEVKGYDKTKLGDQVITISYAGKEQDLPIKVENFVKGIEVTVASWAKVDYVVGDKISLNGVTIKKVMEVLEPDKDTTITKDSDDYSNLLISPSPDEESVGFNTNKVEMIYTTDNTKSGKTEEFKAEYAISVLRPLSTIRVNNKNSSGYAHESFNFGTVLSGEDEQHLKEGELKTHIINEGGLDVTSTVEVKIEKIENNQMQVMLKFDEKGDYQVYFYVGGSFEYSTIKSDVQPVHIEYNPTVDKVQIKNVNETTITLRKEKFIERDITFINIHGDILTDVLAKTIDFADTNNRLIFTKLNGDHPVSSSEEPVNRVRITGKEEGNTVVKITVNKDTSNIDTKTLGSAYIREEAAKTIALGNKNDLIIYQEPQLVQIDNVLEYKGVIYTLIPIYIADEDNDTVIIKGTDLVLGNATKENKLGIRYTGFNPTQESLLKIELFDDNKPGSEPVTSEDPIEYIGVALNHGADPDELIATKLMIEYYKATNTEQVPIQIEPLRIRELVVKDLDSQPITKTPTGYNHQQFNVGIITSGARQKDVTQSDFYTNGVKNYRVEKLVSGVWQDVTNNTVTVTDASGKTTTKKAVDVEFGYSNTKGVQLNFISEETGENRYKVTFWVNVAGASQPVSQTQEVKTDNDPVVANARILDMSDLVKDTLVIRDIQFTNQYGDVLQNVYYNDIIKDENGQIIGDGIKAQVLNENEKPTGIVSKIELMATRTGDVSLTLAINDKILPAISFVAKEPAITINVNGTKTIVLYEEKPAGVNNIGEDDDGYIYTLIPFSIDGTDRPIYGDKLNEGGEATQELPVGITGDGIDDSLVMVKMFNKDKRPESGSDVAYIGIALWDEPASSMIGKTFTITYIDAEDPVTITVVAQ